MAGNRRLVKLCKNKKHEFTQFEWALGEQCLLSNLISRAHLEAAAQIKRFGPKGETAEGDAFHVIMSSKKDVVF